MGERRSEVKGGRMDGWRTEGAAATCVWFTRLAALSSFSLLLLLLLLCDASWWFSEGPGCLEFPPPLKSLCCSHSCIVHITSPAPSYSPPPPPPPPANDSRARPLHKATAFSTSCTYTQARNFGTHTHKSMGHTRAD